MGFAANEFDGTHLETQGGGQGRIGSTDPSNKLKPIFLLAPHDSSCLNKSHINKAHLRHETK